MLAGGGAARGDLGGGSVDRHGQGSVGQGSVGQGSGGQGSGSGARKRSRPVEREEGVGTGDEGGAVGSVVIKSEDAVCKSALITSPALSSAPVANPGMDVDINIPARANSDAMGAAVGSNETGRMRQRAELSSPEFYYIMSAVHQLEQSRGGGSTKESAGWFEKGCDEFMIKSQPELENIITTAIATLQLNDGSQQAALRESMMSAFTHGRMVHLIEGHCKARTNATARAGEEASEETVRADGAAGGPVFIRKGA